MYFYDCVIVRERKMWLKPSNIFYCQDSISSTFGRSTNHSEEQIGTTLDDLYYGRIKIEKIPKITVVKRDDGKWYTANNRRLWIFHHLEGAGKCSEIEVLIGTSLSRFTTENGGTSVRIYRGNDPGGACRRFVTPVIPRQIENDIQGSSSQNDKEDTSKEDDNKSECTELCKDIKPENPDPGLILNQSSVTNTSTRDQQIVESSSEPRNDLVDNRIIDPTKINQGVSKPADDIGESEDEVLKPESNGVSNVGKNEEEKSESKADGTTNVGENVGKGLELKQGGSTDGDIEEGKDKSLELEPHGFTDIVQEDKNSDFESKRGRTVSTGDSEDKSFGPKVDDFTDRRENKDKCFESQSCITDCDGHQASNTDADCRKYVLGEKRNLSNQDDNMEKPKKLKGDIPENVTL